jgi:hypothetical protein
MLAHENDAIVPTLDAVHVPDGRNIKPNTHPRMKRRIKEGERESSTGTGVGDGDALASGNG